MKLMAKYMYILMMKTVGDKIGIFDKLGIAIFD